MRGEGERKEGKLTAKKEKEKTEKKERVVGGK